MSATESTTEPSLAQRPASWWTLFALGTLAILAFVPYANAIQRSVRERIGDQGVRWLMISVVALVAVAVARAVGHRLAGIAPMRLVPLVVLPALAALWMYRMSVTAEAFHLVEYGLLGAVAYRAFACHLRGRRVFVAAAVLTALVGLLDEFLQWLTPGRFGDLADVGLNVAGGVLAQVWIAASLWALRYRR